MKEIRPPWFDRPNIRTLKKGDLFTVFGSTIPCVFLGYDRSEKGYKYHFEGEPENVGILRETRKDSVILTRNIPRVCPTCNETLRATESEMPKSFPESMRTPNYFYGCACHEESSKSPEGARRNYNDWVQRKNRQR